MIKIDAGTPFMDEALEATVGEVQYTYCSVVDVAMKCDIMDQKRLDEVDEFITSVEQELHRKVMEFIESDCEYYTCIGAFVVDMWLTFYGNMKTDVDMYKMQEEFGSFDE